MLYQTKLPPTEAGTGKSSMCRWLSPILMKVDFCHVGLLEGLCVCVCICTYMYVYECMNMYVYIYNYDIYIYIYILELKAKYINWTNVLGVLCDFVGQESHISTTKWGFVGIPSPLTSWQVTTAEVSRWSHTAEWCADVAPASRCGSHGQHVPHRPHPRDESVS